MSANNIYKFPFQNFAHITPEFNPANTPRLTQRLTYPDDSNEGDGRR
jgi:hypothetical protein